MGVLLPLISEGAGGTTEGVEYATGDTGTLYVMKTPASYIKTAFGLNPESSSIISRLNFYVYADHDVTHYYDGTENYFTFYVDITNPNTSYSQTENAENFNPSTMSREFSSTYLENVNLSWADNYNVTIEVEDDRAIGAGNVYWTFSVVVKSIEMDRPRERMIVGFVRWLGVGASRLSEIVAGSIRGLFTAIVGKDVAEMAGSFLASMGRVLTMDFGGIPNVLRVMIATPLWIGVGYITIILIRSFIPTVGGGSAG